MMHLGLAEYAMKITCAWHRRCSEYVCPNAQVQKSSTVHPQTHHFPITFLFARVVCKQQR